MSARNRAIRGTEDEFQAALKAYTTMGNKTAAMRRLWNTAYEMGRVGAAAGVILAGGEGRGQVTKDTKSERVTEARQLGFEEGRRAGEQEALTLPAFQLSFLAGKTEGLAEGTERGRETEEKRWIDRGHLDSGTCRARDESQNVAALAVPLPLPLSPIHVPGAFDWADDAESLPIHTVLLDVQPPRDFSALRSSAKNPFQTLQRRHARHHGVRTRSRRPYQQFHSTPSYTIPPSSTRPLDTLAGAARSKTMLSFFGLLVWLWTAWYMPLRTQGAPG
ncbi:hypothetical protein C8R46DRAFT_1087641 [Mycena filopes]|nr:hypothetical protein C8R46DRAFT_1087641 [Mycena filopes]